MKKLSTTLIVLLAAWTVRAQGYETLKKEELVLQATGKNMVLSVLNVNGNVKIKGTDRSDILLKYTLKAEPKSRNGLVDAREDLRVEIEEFKDSAAIVLTGPFVKYRDGRRSVHINSQDLDYWFNCKIEVEVPRSLNIEAATINDGDVIISQVSGTIIADNVNGGIDIRDGQGKVIAETVNGNIEVNFTSNPGDGSTFQSVNGNIETNVPEDLSAKIAFKSMNGEFYTDFEYSTSHSDKVTRRDRSRGTEFKVEQITNVSIGSGKASLFYETLNGNMFLTKLN